MSEGNREKGTGTAVFDVHYHLLPGLDDGPATLDDAVRLAQASIAEGVTHIVCTPHANDHYRFDADVNREKVAVLQAAVGPKLQLGLGCDFHLSFENIESLFVSHAPYTINGGRYLLVEFPDFGIAPNMAETFYEMTVAGVIPIITHPERNPTLIAEPGRLAEWIEGGCLVQITAASLVGRFGRRAEAVSNELVKRNWAHLVASDAHSVERRPPAMHRAYQHIQSRFGEHTARHLCIDNPRAIFFNEDLPAVADVAEQGLEDRPAKKGLLERLFGR